ncbi:MAG: hypothetical protein HY791_36915 [Deltaproteobacteria bacterium]|nr:hypothetical protein [Deltaproteobacteria bacterium]
MSRAPEVDVVSIGNPYEWLHGDVHAETDIEDSAELLGSQKALFWPTRHGFPTASVVEVGPSASLRDHFAQCLGRPLPRIVTPRRTTGSICHNLLSDQDAFEALLSHLDPARPVHLAPYMLTRGVEEVGHALGAKGFQVIDPPRASELVARWSSKVEIDLEVYRTDPLIRSARPRSFVAQDFGALAALYRDLRADGLRRVVVKSARSAGGAGVYFVDLSSAVEATDARATLETKGVNPSHVAPPFLVEEEITWTFSPSIDLDVLPSGQVRFVGAGVQRLYDRRYYAGFATSEAMYREAWFEDALEICEAVARRFGAAGFDGPLNFDLVVTAESRVVLIETNVRRSALCDGYGIAEILGASRAIRQGPSKWGCFSFADYVESRLTSDPSRVIATLPPPSESGEVVLTSDASLASPTPTLRWVSLASVSEVPAVAEANLAEVCGRLMGLPTQDAVRELGTLHTM